MSSLGADALAAVGVATQIHFTIFSLLAAITTGAVAVVARECGSGNLDEAAHAARCALALAAGFGALLMLAIPFSESIIGLLVGTIANLVNVVGDYALVFGRLGAPELGAVGSAWATGISFTVAMLLMVALWLRGLLRLPPADGAAA